MEKEMHKPTYFTLFATKGNRRRMRVIIALGFVSSSCQIPVRELIVAVSSLNGVGTGLSATISISFWKCVSSPSGCDWRLTVPSVCGRDTS